MAGEHQAYSKAFENLVQGEDDLVGLLAYALFKQGVRENVARGLVGDTSRDPSPTQVDAYRRSAERRLELLLEASIAEATPEIQRSALLETLASMEADLKGHVTRRTGFIGALGVNLLAWIITLAATVLILSIAGRPDPGQTLADMAKSLGRPEKPARSSAPAPLDRH